MLQATMWSKTDGTSEADDQNSCKCSVKLQEKQMGHTDFAEM